MLYLQWKQWNWNRCLSQVCLSPVIPSMLHIHYCTTEATQSEQLTSSLKTTHTHTPTPTPTHTHTHTHYKTSQNNHSKRYTQMNESQYVRYLQYKITLMYIALLSPRTKLIVAHWVTLTLTYILLVKISLLYRHLRGQPG
jgi:hypothetical protein